MKLTPDFKNKVRIAILEARENYGGNASQFAKTLGVSPSIFSRLKNTTNTEHVLADAVWIDIGRKLDVRVHESNWKVARTTVYREIEDNLNFCKELSKSMILADDCGIGKTFCTKHIIKNMTNAFYVDCSQAKTRYMFVKLLAKTIGVSGNGTYADIKEALKYYINLLDKPIIVLDEAGDLAYEAFMDLKELWNATDGSCGWYMMGADGLRDKITRGIKRKTVGYAEIFSRFSDDFVSLVPAGTTDRKQFMADLIGSVASINTSRAKVDKLVRQCLNKDASLRYLETLIKIDA